MTTNGFSSWAKYGGWAVAIGAGAVIAAMTIRGWSEANAQDIREHAQVPGHPVMVERVNAVQNDIREIREDLNEIKSAVSRIERKLQ